MKVTMIPIIVGALRIVTKDLEKKTEEQDIRGRIETKLSTVLLKSARILKRVQDISKDLLSLEPQ